MQCEALSHQYSTNPDREKPWMLYTVSLTVLDDKNGNYTYYVILINYDYTLFSLRGKTRSWKSSKIQLQWRTFVYEYNGLFL